MSRTLLFVSTLLAAPAILQAQTAPMNQTASAAPLQLSLSDAVSRGLEHNLQIILQEQRTHEAGSARLAALSELLPHMSGDVRETRQVLSTAVFGFTLPDLPTLIGPFNVFDARLSVSAPIIDLSNTSRLRAASALETAATADYKQVRETVVLSISNLYLMALADQARLASADAQVATATALSQSAQDQHAAGTVARIDSVRQDVQLQGARAAQIAAANTFAVRKLQLARAIGVPAGQAIVLTTGTGFGEAPIPTLEAAIAEASANRQDLAALRARVAAAESTHAAAVAGHLPTLHVDGDIGAVGNTVGSVEKTYAVVARVHVPIFSGGKTQAEAARAASELKQREAELSDLEAGVRYDVQAALLTLQSTAAGVDVAKSAEALSREQLTQSQDRFVAGVAGSIEVVQAQEAVAKASEQYISARYANAIAKASLARAMGVSEERLVKLVGGLQ